MKKIFIGLLIVAAGAAIFLLLPKKDNLITANNFQQEQIIGKWKLDSLHYVKDSRDKLMQGIMQMVNSDSMKCQYEFTRDGTISFYNADVSVKDTARYEWNKANQLVWKDNPADTAGEVFSVSMLTTDSLVIQSKDSAVLLFTKVK